MLGREVTTLVNEEKQTGKYEVEFNANLLTSGVYFYKLFVTSNKGYFTNTKKMILLKYSRYAKVVIDPDLSGEESHYLIML